VYAIKVIDNEKLKNKKNLTNLVNEIAIMSEIRSPHIVALLNATKTSRNYYLAMELCNGGDLDNFKRQRGGYLREEEARLILCQIVKGITAIKT
jgi:serine/threonine-protein kinase ULK/ATG1